VRRIGERPTRIADGVLRAMAVTLKLPPPRRS